MNNPVEWDDENPTGEARFEDVLINEDELDSVGIVDLFCDETFEDVPKGGLTIDTSMDYTIGFPSPGKLFSPSLLDISTPEITPRTFNYLCVGLDFDHLFDDPYTSTGYGYREFNSKYGRSIAIDRKVHSGIDLGKLITNTNYSYITYGPFSP